MRNDGRNVLTHWFGGRHDKAVKRAHGPVPAIVHPSGNFLLAGCWHLQFILFGSSLIGRKILLPLDVLALPGIYLPPDEAAAWGEPWDPVLTDPTLEMEMDRRYAVSEIRAGRLPLWNPHEYCGQPFLAANQTAVFSPFRIPDYLWPGTLVIAWDQVLKSMVAGIGAYLFFRVALRTGFIAALFGGWIIAAVRVLHSVWVIRWEPRRRRGCRGFFCSQMGRCASRGGFGALGWRSRRALRF